MPRGMLFAADLSPRLVIIAMLGTFNIAGGSKAAVGYCDVAIISAVGGGRRETANGRFGLKTSRSTNQYLPRSNHAVSNLCLPVSTQASTTDSRLIDWAFNKLESANEAFETQKKSWYARRVVADGTHAVHVRYALSVYLLVTCRSAHNVTVCLSPSASPTDDKPPLMYHSL